MGDSQFWAKLLSMKDFFFFKYVKKNVGDGRNIRFSEEWWVVVKQLNQCYPRLYGLCFTKNIKLANVVEKGWDHFTFRRTLEGLYTDLMEKGYDIELNEEKDSLVRPLTVDGKYTIKSFYNQLSINNS